MRPTPCSRRRHSTKCPSNLSRMTLQARYLHVRCLPQYVYEYAVNNLPLVLLHHSNRMMSMQRKSQEVPFIDQFTCRNNPTRPRFHDQRTTATLHPYAPCVGVEFQPTLLRTNSHTDGPVWDSIECMMHQPAPPIVPPQTLKTDASVQRRFHDAIARLQINNIDRTFPLTTKRVKQHPLSGFRT